MNYPSSTTFIGLFCTFISMSSASTTSPFDFEEIGPSFGEWIGGVNGQLPMNFSDVKPHFMVPISVTSNGMKN